MRKLLVVLALVAIAGCSSPVGVDIPEEADPNIAFEYGCEADPDPNSFLCGL